MEGKVLLNTEAAALGFEFWAFVPDYESFAALYPVSAQKLNELCELRRCQVKIFLGSSEGYAQVQSVVRKNRDNYAKLYVCKPFADVTNGHVLLRRVSLDGEYDYFVATERGFEQLEPREWQELEKNTLTQLASLALGEVP